MKPPFHAIPDEYAGTFGVILVDPPWTFETYSANGQEKSPQAHYRCMSITDLRRLPVAELAAPDCALFLWCTWPLMMSWGPLIEAWGFTYKGLAWEWFKYNVATGKFAFGTGYGTRKNVEPCLLATRGDPKRLCAGERDFIMAPRREHSRKPDEQYFKIERLFAGPYIELFSRGDAPDHWAQWGDQLDTFSTASRELNTQPTSEVTSP